MLPSLSTRNFPSKTPLHVILSLPCYLFFLVFSRLFSSLLSFPTANSIFLVVCINFFFSSLKTLSSNPNYLPLPLSLYSFLLFLSLFTFLYSYIFLSLSLIYISFFSVKFNFHYTARLCAFINLSAFHDPLQIILI